MKNLSAVCNQNNVVDPCSIGDESWYDLADRIFATTIKYGESAEWNGPASLWLVRGGDGWELAKTDQRRTRGGKPKAGEPFQPLEAVLPPSRFDRRCRFCGHLERLPSGGYCLGCHRHGQDDRIGSARLRTDAPLVMPTRAEDDGLDGGLKRRVAAHKTARPQR